MIKQKEFFQHLELAGVRFFTGVPDSYLNGFCNMLLETVPAERHIIAANEGNAVAIAAGYYFGTGEIPLIYLQNSGLGNTVNPLLSLAHPSVYQVPCLLLIGWRGQPESGDHVQHEVQGQITPDLLKLMGIPYQIAEADDRRLAEQMQSLVETAKQKKTPVALIAPKGVFSEEKKANQAETQFPLYREEAIECILDHLPAETIYVATTGRATRELYFLREKRGESHSCDFLNIGAMGHASSVAFGLALSRPDRKVVCLDGDAAALMHLGAFAMASCQTLPNLLHVLLNNGAHESVGGQPSLGRKIDCTTLAKAAGYATVEGPVTTREEIRSAIDRLNRNPKQGFLDIRINKGMTSALPPLDIPSYADLIQELEEELQANEEVK